MPRLEFRLPLPGVLQQALFEFHRDPRALTLLTPPEKRVTVVERPAEMSAGALVVLRVTQLGVSLTWVSVIEIWDPPRSFVDVQVKGPFARWRHEHLFSDGLLVDRIDYEVPFAAFGGRLVDRLFIRPDLTSMFAHRHRVTREQLLPS